MLYEPKPRSYCSNFIFKFFTESDSSILWSSELILIFKIHLDAPMVNYLCNRVPRVQDALQDQAAWMVIVARTVVNNRTICARRCKSRCVSVPHTTTCAQAWAFASAEHAVPRVQVILTKFSSLVFRNWRRGVMNREILLQRKWLGLGKMIMREGMMGREDKENLEKRTIY